MAPPPPPSSPRLPPLAFFALLLLWPSLAWANAGTPMILTRATHLVFGNALIGMLEAALVIRLLKAPRLSTVVRLVLANYASMLGGLLAVGSLLGPWSERLELADLTGLVAVFALATFLISILIEWPFVHASAPKEGRRLRRTLGVCVLAQLLSYGFVLAPAYAYATNLSLLGGDVVELTSIGPVEPGWIYYVPVDAQSVRRFRTDGSEDELVYEVDLPLLYGDAQLQPRPASDAADATWQLHWVPTQGSGAGIGPGDIIAWDGSQTLLDPFPQTAPWPSGPSLAAWYARTPGDSTAETRRGMPRHETVFTDSWGSLYVEGLGRLAVDGPGVSLRAASPNLLPGGLVVFELQGRIVALDPATRRVSELRRGHCPLVVLDSELVSEPGARSGASDPERH